MELNELMNVIDELSALAIERKELTKKADAFKKQEDDLKARLMQEMNYLGLTTLSGKTGAVANMKRVVEPVVSDWPTLLEHIRSTGSLDLLHRRLTVAAVKLRWADGIALPGVDAYEETKLTIS